MGEESMVTCNSGLDWLLEIARRELSHVDSKSRRCNPVRQDIHILLEGRATVLSEMTVQQNIV